MPVDLPPFRLLEGERLHACVAVESGGEVAKFAVHLGHEGVGLARVACHLGERNALRVFFHPTVGKGDLDLVHRIVLQNASTMSTRSARSSGSTRCSDPTYVDLVDFVDLEDPVDSENENALIPVRDGAHPRFHPASLTRCRAVALRLSTSATERTGEP